MDDYMTPQNVANAFVLSYYKILSDSPQLSYKFYKESSLLSWPNFDGNLAPVTTLNAIKEKIMSSDFKNFTIKFNTVDAQASQDGGIIIAVTGSLIGDDQVTNIFIQTFFLAKQEIGFFVLNDNLRIFDSFGSMTNAAANPLAVQTSDEKAVPATKVVPLPASNASTPPKVPSIVVPGRFLANKFVEWVLKLEKICRRR